MAVRQVTVLDQPEPPLVAAPKLVGRDREFAALRRAIGQVPAVVLVEGEAGVGKSRLLHELGPAGGARIVTGSCPPYREALTLGPIVDAVRQAGPGVAGLRLSDLAGALRPLFPEWAAQLPPLPEPLADPRAARHRLYRALVELIGRAGVTGLVVEDAHWADPATLEFLLFLAASQRPVALVVTYRPEDLPADTPLRRLSSLPAGTTRTRITLPPLGPADTAAMVSSMLGGEPVADELAGLLHHHTDGVPLAVEESVRLLADRADLVRQDGAWTRGSRRELPVPPTVRDAVLERLGRLGAAARRVLTAAAVLAGPVDQALLGRVAGLREDQAWAGIRAARAAGLLHEDEQGRVSFRHVLMGRAVYQAAPALERRHYHRAAGEVLADLDPPPVGQLARHFREAGETTRWARYAEQAASQAADSGDRVTAVSLLDELVATAELPVPTRTRLAATLADTAVLGWEAVDQARQQVVGTLRAVLARPGLSPAEQAAIRNPLGRLLMQHGHWDAGRQELVQAVDHLAHDPMEAARVMGYLGLPIGPGPAAAHLSWLRRAAELEPLIRSPLDRLVLAVDRAAALLALGEEAGWTAAQLPPAAPGVEWQYQLARGQFNTGSAALVWGRYQTARQQLAAARELADRHRFARLQARIPVSQAWLDWLTGAWQGLAGRLAALTSLAADPVAPFQVVLLLGLLRSAQGEPRLAGRLLERALGDAGRLGQTDETVAPAAALARVRLSEGRPGEALRVTDQPMDTIAAKRVWIWAADIAPVRLEGLLAADRTDQARRLISDFARGLRGRAAPAPHAALATCRAILLDRTGGDQRRAATAYGRAAAAWQRLPRPYDALLCRERQAACLLASGRVEAGRTRLVEVHSGLSRLGASGDADRVGQRLRELGVEVRRPWRGGRRGYGDRLSPRELEVVRLVAAGRTNREIAAALSRSQHTVATQVHSAMRKLGVPSRTALAVSAVQAGVVARAPAEAGG